MYKAKIPLLVPLVKPEPLCVKKSSPAGIRNHALGGSTYERLGQIVQEGDTSAEERSYCQPVVYSKGSGDSTRRPLDGMKTHNGKNIREGTRTLVNGLESHSYLPLGAQKNHSGTKQRADSYEVMRTPCVGGPGYTDGNIYQIPVINSPGNCGIVQKKVIPHCEVPLHVIPQSSSDHNVGPATGATAEQEIPTPGPPQFITPPPTGKSAWPRPLMGSRTASSMPRDGDTRASGGQHAGASGGQHAGASSGQHASASSDQRCQEKSISEELKTCFEEQSVIRKRLEQLQQELGKVTQALKANSKRIDILQGMKVTEEMAPPKYPKY